MLDISLHIERMRILLEYQQLVFVLEEVRGGQA